nr:MAG TPA: hypothetical protein [Caudoviricetes sp.]
MINTFYLAGLISHNIISAIWGNEDNVQTEKGAEEDLPQFNIYPIVAFPSNDTSRNQHWITFKRISTTPSYSKDGLVCDKVEFEINVAAGSYSESCVYASYIRHQFCQGVLRDTDKVEEANTFLKHCELIDASEDFEQDVYIQTLTFSGEVYYTEKKQPTTTEE